MQDLRIDGRWQRVFVLRDTKERVAYIPVKSLHRVDYDRLVKAERDAPKNVDLMDYLRKTKFENGRNALVQLDNIIQVANRHSEHEAGRLRKSHERVETNLITVQREVEDTREVNKISGAPKTEKKADDNTPEDGAEYEYTHHRTGKSTIWGGKGPMPKVIAEHVEEGGKLSDFLKK